MEVWKEEDLLIHPLQRVYDILKDHPNGISKTKLIRTMTEEGYGGHAASYAFGIMINMHAIARTGPIYDTLFTLARVAYRHSTSDRYLSMKVKIEDEGQGKHSKRYIRMPKAITGDMVMEWIGAQLIDPNLRPIIADDLVMRFYLTEIATN